MSIWVNDPPGAGGGVEAAAVKNPWRILFETSGRVTKTAASGTSYFSVTGASDVSSQGVGASNFYAFRLAAVDYAISGYTTKLMIESICQTSTEAPAVTCTLGLYPVVAGASSSPGILISGSTLSFTSPSASAITTGMSSEFAFPADGVYAIGYTLSGTPSGVFTLSSVLQLHYT